MNGLVDSYCRGCKYLMYAGGVKACDYIGAKNKRRPCPAGKGCTVKVIGKKFDWRRGG